MKFNEYQHQAMYFRKPSANSVYAVLGLVEEAGEVAGKVAKTIRDGAEPGALKAHIKKELGDVLWMVAAVASDYNLTLEEIASANILKLTDRLSRGTISGQGDDR